jgi:hypothetical protein
VCSGSQIDYKTFSHNNITHILYVPVATHGHLPISIYMRSGLISPKSME